MIIIISPLHIDPCSADKDYPIYQTGCEAHLYTIHTAVYSWEKRYLTIYVGNPKLEKVLYKFNI